MQQYQNEHVCPICNTYLIRIRRKLSDRIQSVFNPVLRYKCPNLSCEWEGVLKLKRGSALK